MTKRVGIYVRVSTKDQNTNIQVSDLSDYAKSRNWSVHKIYEDKKTGTNLNRLAFIEMMKDLQYRKIDIVLVWKLDRAFRSLKDMVLTLQEIHELGCEFVSLKDSLDLTTNTGRLMIHIIGAFAEFEASLIRERVRAGVDKARLEGKILGRPSTIDIQKVFKLREQGCSLTTIAKNLRCSKSGVSKILSKNRSLKG